MESDVGNATIQMRIFNVAHAKKIFTANALIILEDTVEFLLVGNVNFVHILILH